MGDILKDVVAFIQDYSEGELANITMDTRMKEDIGLDSLSLIMMVDDAERKFNIVIPDDQLLSLKTIGDIVRCIEEQSV